MRNELWLLPENGSPIWQNCSEWRERYLAARTAAWTFASSLGSRGFFPGFDGELMALIPVDPIPDGWCIPKKMRVRDQLRMIPTKGPNGDVARAAIAALPPPPRHTEIAKLIQHPLTLRWESESGCGFSDMGDRWDTVQLTWPSGSGSPLIILAPDANRIVAEHKEQYPSHTVTMGEWIMPDDLKVISEARKNLIFAEWEVKSEEAP